MGSLPPRRGPRPPLPAAGARLVGAATSCDHGAQAWPRARADSDWAEREGASGPGGLHVGVGGAVTRGKKPTPTSRGLDAPSPHAAFATSGTRLCAAWLESLDDVTGWEQKDIG